VWQTDGHTDGQNYDSQDRASIAASRGNNNHSGIVSVHFTGASVWHRHCTEVAQRRSTKLWPSSGLVHYYIGLTYTVGGSCSLMEFCQVQNSLCVWVLRSHILAALLHGTQAVGSAKLCGTVYKEWNYGTFTPCNFQQRPRPIFRGRHHVAHRPNILVAYLFAVLLPDLSALSCHSIQRIFLKINSRHQAHKPVNKYDYWGPIFKTC